MKRPGDTEKESEMGRQTVKQRQGEQEGGKRLGRRDRQGRRWQRATGREHRRLGTQAM